MVYIIILIVLTLAIILLYFETHSQHPSSIMGRYLRKKWENKNPYDVVSIKNKTFTFHFTLDENEMIRGVLRRCNESLTEEEKRINHKKDNKNDITSDLDIEEIIGIKFKSIRVIYKGIKYISYWIEEQDNLFQHYMEDRKWEGSIAKKIGIKGITNVFTM